MTRILVVVPNRATFVTAWCFEFALTNIQQGHEVYFLDLARIESRYLERPWTWKLDNLLEKNNIRNILPSVCEKSGVKIIAKVDKAIPALDLDARLLEHFELCLRSTYAQFHGGFGINLSDISTSTQTMERRSYLLASSIVTDAIKKHKIEHVVTVNGRGIIDGAAILAAKRNNCKYTMIEKVTENWNYYSCMRVSAQSPSEVFRQILSKPGIGKSKSVQNVEVGEYFERRKSVRNVYSLGQSVEMTPIKGAKNYVVFFPTSDYEFATFNSQDEVPQGSFKDQIDAFRTLVDVCLKERLSLVIRVHPHAAGSPLQRYENEFWTAIAESSGSEVIPSESPLKSLSIAKNAVLSVTHNSSIGTELIHEGLPLLITGPTSYGGFFPELLALNGGELFAKFSSINLPLEKERLWPWVNFMTSGQNELKYFSMSAFDQVSYLGTLLNSNRAGSGIFFELARRFRFWRKLPLKN